MTPQLDKPSLADLPARLEQLSAYLDDALDPGERAQVDQLLATDAEARRQLEELRGVALGIRRLEVKTPPPSLDLEMLRGLVEMTRQPRLLADFQRRFRGMGWVVIFFVLIIALMLWYFAAHFGGFG